MPTMADGGAGGGATPTVEKFEDGSSRVEAPAKPASAMLWDKPTSEGIREAAARKFAVPMDMEDAMAWREAIAEGRADENTFVEWARMTAASLYPAFKQQIVQGVEPSLLLSPYKRVAEEELGRKVDWLEPVLQEGVLAAHQVGQQEQGLAAFRKHLRSQPEWDDGPAAQRMVERLMRQLGGV